MPLLQILDGVHVHEARGRMGERLAQHILQDLSAAEGECCDVDVVIPVPETSRTAALRCAHILGVPYREVNYISSNHFQTVPDLALELQGLVKNRYIARTFIMPGQEVRRKSVRLKLNCIRSEFAGKAVLLVDDSIVRGTTAVELVQMARDAGAKRVYFASAAPPVLHPNVYGIDIPTRGELVAYGRTVEEIRVFLQADR
jgi:amidophosphoribosyltransferase